MTPLLLFFINRSEGKSSAPVPSNHYYRPAKHHKQLIPQNFQPYSRQNINLSIISIKKGLLLRLVQANTEIIRQVWHRIIFADSFETIYWATNLRAIVIFDEKAETRVFSHCNTWIMRLLGPMVTLQEISTDLASAIYCWWFGVSHIQEWILHYSATVTSFLTYSTALR